MPVTKSIFAKDSIYPSSFTFSQVTLCSFVSLKSLGFLQKQIMTTFQFLCLFYYKYMIKENQSRSSVNQMLSRQLVQTRNANFFKGWSCTKRSGTHDWYPTLQQLPSMRNSGSPNKQENSILPFLSFPVPL